MMVKQWQSLPKMFFDNAQKQKTRPLFCHKEHDAWRTITWQEAANAVRAAAQWIKEEGIKEEVGEEAARCVIVAENSPHWAMADMAIMTAQAITVPLFMTHRSEDHLYCINSVQAVLVFASEQALPSLRAMLPQAKSVRTVIMLDGAKAAAAAQLPKNIKVTSWQEILQEGAKSKSTIEIDAITRADICSIIHTSGTSSHPKGVMLSHGAILANGASAAAWLADIGLRKHRFMSFLPLAHSFERTCCQFFPMMLGDALIIYAENVEQLVANMAEMQPTLMAAVPRLYQSMERRLLDQMRRASGIKGWLLRQTWHWGRQRIERNLTWLQRAWDGFLTLLIRRAIGKKFGGKLQLLISGGAPLPMETNKNLDAFGLTVLQGYGQTEAAPIISCNAPFANHFGTVGKPFANVQLRISKEGEICVRGENVMQGYWQDEQATHEALRDGWLHTGDGGMVDEHGCIVITDRLKDMIVNSGGDNIAPVKIEEHLCRHDAIAQAAVFGDGIAYLVAVLVMEETWNGREAAIKEMLAETNRQLQPFERVKKFLVAKEPFTVDNQLMTPTLKVRRRAIAKHYEKDLKPLMAVSRH